MTLEEVIASATHLAAAVDAGDLIVARRLAADTTTLAGQAELQTVAHAAHRVAEALAAGPAQETELGLAMTVLADEIALLINEDALEQADGP